MHKKVIFSSQKAHILLVSLLLWLFSAPSFAQNRSTHNASVSKNLELFDEIYRMLDLFYVDTLSADTVMQWAIEGMLRRVDPFTEYYPEENDDLRQMATGKYAGIGAVIRYLKSEDRTVIAEPYFDTPSSRAGLKAGDIIISIDGKDTKGMSTQKVSQMLRGEAGTTFTLVYRTAGDSLCETVVTRETIQLPSIPYYGILEDGVGYIFLSSFTEGCATAMRMALLEMKSKGVKRLLLDLRNNPGGSLSEAVDVVNLFVNKGEKVVHHRSRGHGTAHCGDGQQRHGLIGGNRVGQSAGPRPGRRDGAPHLRQRPGADGPGTQQRRCGEDHHLALLHPLRAMHPGS